MTVCGRMAGKSELLMSGEFPEIYFVFKIFVKYDYASWLSIHYFKQLSVSCRRGKVRLRA